MMTFLSEFRVGETVWEAFAYMRTDGRPFYRIRKGIVVSVNDGAVLLGYEDGRADFTLAGSPCFRHRCEAISHCVLELTRLRNALTQTIDEVLAMYDEDSGGPAGASHAEPTGTAPPAVAT